MLRRRAHVPRGARRRAGSCYRPQRLEEAQAKPGDNGLFGFNPSEDFDFKYTPDVMEEEIEMYQLRLGVWRRGAR